MKIRPILEPILDDVDFDELPSAWSRLDTVSFSKSKKLWDFQQDALKNAIKVLYQYFNNDEGEKPRFIGRYRINGLDGELEEILDIRLSRVNKQVISILQRYYPIEDSKLKFHNFINRASFWMATGSGKTLLIIKLIESLKRLMDLEEIPRKDILVLTYRDDLINQLKRHISEFNELAPERGFLINFVELTEYDKVKRESLVPFLDEVIVFYYRSDLISDEQKEKLVDYRNYENNGNWYILLDEAHKGDKEESKRQMYYSIMSRNGFIFNFSATFTDPRDIVSTAYNFNLEKFIKAGYGKHLYILRQEMQAFREKEDYNREGKQEIVLKALILLAYLKKTTEEIKRIAGEVYHEPMILVLVNTVNLSDFKKEKPDLTLFYEQLGRIGKGDVSEKVFEKAKEELLDEFYSSPQLIYEEGAQVNISKNIIEGLKITDILKYTYNSESFGNIEAILVPGRRQEAVLKLKTSDKPFALIKIGDAIRWIRDNLKGYEVTESYEDKSVFENLDEREDISILMGSRAFYEGWDSNRPNIIIYINIGIGAERKKFIIQSVGRGVRIEPVKGKRRRLQYLYNRSEDSGLYEKIGLFVQPIETLFVFGTNRDVLTEVVSTLKMEKEIEETIELERSGDAGKHCLLIPVFRISSRKLYQERELQKFTVSERMFEVIKDYFTTTDGRVLIAQNTSNNLTPELLAHIRNSFDDYVKYYRILPEEMNTSLNAVIQKLIDHFNLNIEELDKFKPLQSEIIHFKRIKVYLDRSEELSALKNTIDSVLKVKDLESKKEELISKAKEGKISFEEYACEIEKLARLSKEETFKDLRIKYVVNHYYVPIILSVREKVDYIRHIIKTASEVEFIKNLEKYLEKNKSKISVDWWMFSKIDEHLDEIYIPYYDPEKNRVRRFKPDFIFWFSKGSEYYIVFVDPKGIKHTDFEHKIDWFKKIFGDLDDPVEFKFGRHRIKVLLYLFTEDVNRVSEGYRKYWLDSVGKVFEKIL
ncbi:MAG: DEAD/DEAH box helicase family protein [Desulfurococcales archaeon]|nr:DEAD/DEAH box helicase family protein [Desulfurococcales archaeon]